MAKRRRRKHHRVLGAAASARRAPAHCKQALSRCMSGRGGRSKARHCMVSFNRCKR